MVMAYIWTGMVLTAVLFSFWSGAGGVLSQAVLEGAQAGVTLTLSMAGAVCLWSGVGRVMECAGLNRILARFLGPVICRLFPSSRKDPNHEMCRLIVMNTASIQLIPANVAAVRAGLGCAAPFDILPAVWVTSLCSVCVGLLAAFLFQRVTHDV